MRIGFDAKRLYCNFTGLGNYSRTLLTNLAKHYHENEYHLYTPKIKHNSITNNFVNNPNYHTYLSDAYFQSFWRSYSIVKQLKKDNIDIFHGLSHEIPLNIKKSGIKTVVTIHDLIFKIYPKTYSTLDKLTYDFKFRNSCENSDKIIAISESTKRDIIELYKIDESKIDVVYQSCSPLYFEDIEDIDDSAILKQYDIPKEYILYVGTVEARKNLKIIIEAYKQLPSDFKIPLVIVGKGKNYKNEVIALINSLNLTKRIIWIDRLENNYELKALYRNSLVLINPSLYEGFGLPIAEALLCKTPVIASNTSSLPEAGGPNSVYFNPTNSEELADAIKRVVRDSELREKMKRLGFEYALENFSAHVTCSKVINAYESILLKK